jgi:predicted RNase H-like nuclease
MSEESAVLGVDGCPGGWIGDLVSGSSVEWLLLPDLAAVLSVPAAAVGIDIPIGLPAVGPRACDVAARARLGVRRSSVFPAPLRCVLDAPSYAQACEVSRAASGRALSKQAWFLVPRIADADRTLTAADHARVVEVHPELVFATLAGVLPPKKDPLGQDLRAKALRVELPEWSAPPRPARMDDALDALACAWTARRWFEGTAEVLGDEVDDLGTPMRIVV